MCCMISFTYKMSNKKYLYKEFHQKVYKSYMSVSISSLQCKDITK